MKYNSYFPHDSNAKDDPKCVLLIESLNPEGYGIYWILVEILREQPDNKYPLQLLPSIARKYNTTYDKVKAVVLNYDLFEIENDLFFFSKSLINRLGEIAEKRLKYSEAGKKGMLKRWESNKKEINSNQNDNDVITTLYQNDNDVITSKVKESKENYIYMSENLENFQNINTENIDNKTNKKNKTKISIKESHEFYKNEIKTNEKNNLIGYYKRFYEILSGANDLEMELTQLMTIKSQVSYNQFCKLYEKSIENNKKFSDQLVKLTNDPKYYKDKTSLYLTLNNWLTSKFDKK